MRARVGQWRLIALLPLVLLLALPSTGWSAGPTGAPLPNRVPSATATRGLLSPSPAPSSPPGIPGWDRPDQPFLNVPARIAAGLAGSGSEGAAPATLPSTPSPRAPSAPPSPTVGSRTGLANASVVGTIRDLETGATLSGINVDIELVGGGCPCNYSTSGSAGGFSIGIAPGVYTLNFSAAEYAPNATTVILAPGAVDHLGTVFLEEDGRLVGVVEGWDPAHEPVPGVNITVTTRIGTGIVDPNFTSTKANGSFSLEVWPVPVRLDFFRIPSLPPNKEARYLVNHTFASPPAGKTLDLGVVYLVRATNLTIHLLDRVTGKAIPSGLLTAVTSLDRLNPSGGCGSPQSPSVCSTGQGPTLEGWAYPGADDLSVVADGYLENQTPIPPVPELAQSRAVNETINLTPEGAVTVKVAVDGGDPTVGGNATPNSDVLVCGLSGQLVGVVPPAATAVSVGSCGLAASVSGFGATVLAYGPPGRDMLELAGDAGIVPLFGNTGYANLTPDRVTGAGYLNFTPGAYVSGQVYWRNGSASSTGPFSALATSTDLSGVSTGAPCKFPLWNASIPQPQCIDQANSTRVGCPTASGTFCLPALPGADEINVSMPDPAESTIAGFNYTWVDVAPFCCVAIPHALALANITSGHVRSINVTSQGSAGGSARGNVSGRVVAGPGEVEPVLSGAEVEWCSTLNAECQAPVYTGANGSFTLSAPVGWGELVVTAANGYNDNDTWVDVGPNSSAGTITMSPLATVIGQVVDPSGTGILDAGISYCVTGVQDVVRPNPCTGLPGGTGTSGEYGGVVPSGPYPGYIYELTASASGYLSNSTWFNGTAGGLIVLPTLTLTPVSASGRPVALGPHPAATPSTWLTGRIVDAHTGAGLDAVLLTACTLTRSQCFALADSTNAYGQFNDSLPLGTYYLDASSPGYVDGSFYLNASAPAPLDAGNLKLVPYAWVAGRVAVSPGVVSSLQSGLGPGPAAVQACSVSNGSTCGVADVLNTAGQYNVTAPPGNDSVDVNGSLLYDLSNETPVTVGSTDLALTLPLAHFPALALDAMVLGSVLDGSDRASPTGPPLTAVPWPLVNCSGSAYNKRCSTQGDGNGSYVLFVAPSEKLTITATQSAFVTLRTNVTVPGPGQSVLAPSLDLTHFGWIQSTIYSSTGARVAYAAVSYSFVVPGTLTVFGNIEYADESGFLNATVYPNQTVNLSAIAPGFGSQSTRSSVKPSRTTSVGFAGLPPYSNTTEFVRSADVNDSLYPSNITVRDPVDAAPVPQALLWVENATHSLVATVVGNSFGQFLVGINPPAASVLILTHPGFEGDTEYVPPPIGGMVSYRMINMTADGVLAGRVVEEPGNVPLPETNVTACEYYPAGACSTVGTNGSGIFWFVGPPGTYVLNLTADGASAELTYSGTISSDGWNWLGNLTIVTDGTVEGTVVGEPFYLPIVGANVTICPTSGGYFPYCNATTPTDPTGGFTITVPPGYYYVNVTAAGYAPWSLEIELGPGELFEMGAIALSRLGEVLGTVADGSTGLPIAGANLTVCNGDGTVCSGWTLSNASGFFLIPGVRPGPELLLATALGYTPGERGITVWPGEATEPGTFYLWPGGAIQQYPVEGQVLWNGTGAPAAGMTVRAEPVGGGSVPATVSGPNGSFVLTVQPGSYTLVVGGPGARTAEVGLAVGNGSVSGIVVRLDRMAYTIAGTVTVLGASGGLGGISVDAEGVASALSGVDGRYALALPNGSYTLSVGPRTAPLLGEVGSVELGLTVNGGGTASEDVALPALGAPVTIEVVDGPGGHPVDGAAVTVVGGASLGVAERVNGTTALNGTATFSLPAGVYVGYVNASGYPPARVAIDVGTPAVGGTYQVVLSGPANAALSALGAWAIPGAIAALVVAGTIGGILLVRWWRARPIVVEAEVLEPRNRPGGAETPETEPIPEGRLD
jgi:hypothetical protein